MKRVDIPALIKAHGHTNLRLFIPCQPFRLFAPLGIGFTSSDDPTSIEECIIDISGRYSKPEDGYKIEITPLDHRYAGRDFYVSDLESLIGDNTEDFTIRVLAGDIH